MAVADESPIAVVDCFHGVFQVRKAYRTQPAEGAKGPDIGYKLITSGGFTFVVQGGIQYVAARAEAHDSTRSEEESDSDWIPLLNLNLGWSF